MKNMSKMRKWATPITIGAFILSAVTGIMLFFKLNLGMVKVVHEWMSWLLVGGTVFHVIANGRLFAGYFSTHLGRAIIVVFILFTCAALIPLGEKQGHAGPPVASILNRTPLSSVAMAAGHTPDEAVALLKANGVKIEGKEQSIAEISRENGKDPVYLLDMIF